MSFKLPSLLTAGLLGVMLFSGSLAPVQAGDGCGKDRKPETTASASAMFGH